MCQHLNRLNKAESLLWDKAWDIFIKTGVWEMPKRKTIKEELVRGPMGTMKEMAEKGIETNIPITIGTHKSLERRSLMADPSGGILGRNRFPGSRDWELEGLIACLRKTCVACHSNICVMPSRIKIGTNGKCEGYLNRDKKTKKAKKK